MARRGLLSYCAQPRPEAGERGPRVVLVSRTATLAMETYVSLVLREVSAVTRVTGAPRCVSSDISAGIHRHNARRLTHGVRVPSHCRSCRGPRSCETRLKKLEQQQQHVHQQQDASALEPSGGSSVSLRGLPELLAQLLRLTDGDVEDSSVSPAQENSGDLSHGTELLGAAPSSGSALSLAPSSMVRAERLRRAWVGPAVGRAPQFRPDPQRGRSSGEKSQLSYTRDQRGTQPRYLLAPVTCVVAVIAGAGSAGAAVGASCPPGVFGAVSSVWPDVARAVGDGGCETGTGAGATT